jgi:hypothetical protein
MKSIFVALSLTTLAFFGNPSASEADAAASVPTATCAWQFAWTPFGIGNWLWADTANRWWYMPVDPQWQKVMITGTYPKARFFSFAVYDNAPVSTGLADHLFDAQITPDQGGINPFVDTNASSASDQTYRITVTRTNINDGNVLRLHADTGWLIYRLYLPNAGKGSMAGVPLPNISITDAKGKTTPLLTCPIFNRRSELVQLQPQILPSVLENPPTLPPVPDRIWFGTPAGPPPLLLPNPDNKYLVSFFMPEYEPGRMIVIRGKMPGFPDTYHGAPVSKPARHFDTVQLRFWEICQADGVSPLPIEGCATDATTPLDGSGFYTVVITNDVLRPDWLPDQVTWLPFGDEQIVPKLIFLRNTLPSSDFSQTIQNALAQGCGFDFTFTRLPTQDQIRQSGQCTQKVMGDYYPEAVWCDQQKFTSAGWQECFRAADLPAVTKPKAR